MSLHGPVKSDAGSPGRLISKTPVLLRAGPSPKKRRRFLPYVADEDSLTWCRVRSEAIQSSKRIANWIKYQSVFLEAACTAREVLRMYRKSTDP